MLTEIFGAEPVFTFELGNTGRFPTTLYLAPEPASAFVHLAEVIVRRFPEYPPYEGVFDAEVPHLTVAHGDDALLSEAEADVQRLLPIRSEAREALLLEEIEPDWGRWRIVTRLPLRA